MLMAEARNKALAGFADECLDWLVVIDADLYSKPSHLWELIGVLKRDRGVAMACASPYKTRPEERGSWSYDSFALIDHGGRQGIPSARVPLWDLDDRAAGWLENLFLFAPLWRIVNPDVQHALSCNGKAIKAVSIGVLPGVPGRQVWLV